MSDEPIQLLKQRLSSVIINELTDISTKVKKGFPVISSLIRILEQLKENNEEDDPVLSDDIEELQKFEAFVEERNMLNRRAKRKVEKEFWRSKWILLIVTMFLFTFGTFYAVYDFIGQRAWARNILIAEGTIIGSSLIYVIIKAMSLRSIPESDEISPKSSTDNKKSQKMMNSSELNDRQLKAAIRLSEMVKSIQNIIVNKNAWCDFLDIITILLLLLFSLICMGIFVYKGVQNIDDPKSTDFDIASIFMFPVIFFGFVLLIFLLHNNIMI